MHSLQDRYGVKADERFRLATNKEFQHRPARVAGVRARELGAHGSGVVRIVSYAAGRLEPESFGTPSASARAASVRVEGLLRARVAERPTFILDRGYQLIIGLLAPLLVFAGTDIRWAPPLVGLILVTWGSVVFTDVTVRGKSVFDPRLAAMAIFVGLGVIVMAVVGLTTA